MQKIFNFLSRLGVVDGITFRARVEDGVGVFLEPNPRVNRMQPNATELPAPGRRTARRASGRWTAKALHILW